MIYDTRNTHLFGEIASCSYGLIVNAYTSCTATVI